ncbi:hypothetical protein Buni01_01803 [Bacteroides uniformis]|jgi:hypothetical protein
MNLETKIIIYKFTPQVFTLTRKNQCAKVQHIIRGQYKKTEGLLIIMHNFL